MVVTLPHEKVEHEPVVGVFILFLISTIFFTLLLQDLFVIVFGIMILGVWVLASSVGKGSAKEDLESVGVTGEHLTVAIPIGIAIGILSLIIGSIIMAVDDTASFLALSTLIIPSMATATAIGTTTVIPMQLALMFEIAAQWLYVAPGEEAGFRVLTVFGLQSIFDNPIIAFFGATLIWAAMHFPLWISTGVPTTMYAVVVIWGIMWAAQFVIIRNYFSNVVSHAVTNTGVLIMRDFETNMNIYTYIILFVILAICIGLAWWYKNE